MKPEYKNRAKPGTHTRESLDRSQMNKYAKGYLEHLESLEVIPPANGKDYTNRKVRYNLENDITVRLSERQFNLAKLSSEGYGRTYDEILIMAGYSPYAVFAKPGNQKFAAEAKKELISKYKYYKVDSVDKMINHLRYNGAAELQIDKEWLLNEQVQLYTECRIAKKYTQAARLLHDISYHVDVDARVSTKPDVTDVLDYAALLTAATKRMKVLPEPEIKDDDAVIIEHEAYESSVVSPVETTNKS